MQRVLLLVLLAGCASSAAIQVVEHSASEPVAPAPFRFELVETASVASGSTVELSFPIASSEAGVQEIERLDVTIRPDVPYELTGDLRGNRTLRLSGRGPVSVTVTYRACSHEPPPMAEDPGAPVDPKLFADELGPTTDPRLERFRRRGVPARVAGGLDLEREVSSAAWIEVLVSGEWRPLRHDEGGLYLGFPHRALVVAHGSEVVLPRAKIDGTDVEPRVTFELRALGGDADISSRGR